jgi:cytidylate kinase
LVVPDGAMVIDTSNLSVEEVVETMLEAIEAKS